MKNISVRKLTIIALIAAAYTALTLGLSFISYHEIQFRVAEVLNLAAFIDPLYGVGVTLGCFLANLLGSDLGPIDWVFGTAATAIAVFGVSKSKNLLMASFMPVISNALIVGLELMICFGAPFWLNTLSVGAGELVVMVCAGYPLFLLIQKKGLTKYIK